MRSRGPIPSFPTDADIESPPPPPPPNQVGKDDMSNINPNPPSVQFDIRHTLTEVDLYQFDPNAGAWNLVCSTPPPANPNPAIGVTQLSGVWLSGDPSKADPRQVMTQLKVFPWRLLPGQFWTTQWSSQSPQQTYGTSFTDQGLQFTLAAGLQPAVIGGLGFSGTVPGLMFSIDGTTTNPIVTIRFPQPSVLNSISAVVYVSDGEFFFFNAPQCSGDGNALTPQSSSQDPTTQVWTLTFPDNGARDPDAYYSGRGQRDVALRD